MTYLVVTLIMPLVMFVCCYVYILFSDSKHVNIISNNNSHWFTSYINNYYSLNGEEHIICFGFFYQDFNGKQFVLI